MRLRHDVRRVVANKVKCDGGVLGAEPLGEGVGGDEVPTRGRLPPLRRD